METVGMETGTGSRGPLRAPVRWALAALVGCAATLALTPSALALPPPTGAISGEVTSASAHTPLEDIEVAVYEAGSHREVGSALTTANGKYIVGELPAGEYEVEFFPGVEGPNYVTQFWEHKSSLTEATLVKVTEGKTTEAIDAALEVGGIVEGTVTNAVTHKAVAKAEVVAYGASEVEGVYAFTDANGHYKIAGLATRSSSTGTFYRIEFAASGYVLQYYNDQPSFSLASPVSVTQEQTTPGIDATLMPKAPIDLSAPVLSGTPAQGQTLSCAPGSWSGVPSPTFTYTWLRDSAPIRGAGTSTYVVQAADAGRGLTCRVTATNSSGSASAQSNTLSVPVPPHHNPPPPPPPKPQVRLLSFAIPVSGSSARVPLACVRATCAGTIQLTVRLPVRRHGRHHRAFVRNRTIVLGSTPYALAAGQSATVGVPLTSAGLRLLNSASHHRLSARLLVSAVGGGTLQAQVLLRASSHRHHHHHHG